MDRWGGCGCCAGCGEAFVLAGNWLELAAFVAMGCAVLEKLEGEEKEKRERLFHKK